MPQPILIRQHPAHAIGFRWLACAALFVLQGAGIALADETVDPLDPLDPFAADAGDERLRWHADLLVRGDHVSGLAVGRDDLSRLRGRIRFGLDYWLGERVELAAGLRIAAGSDDNADNRRNNDNERSNSVGLDQLALRWRIGEHGRLNLGKQTYDMDLSPLLWDPDLRPAGIGYEHAWPIGDFHRVVLRGGWHAGQHLYRDTSRITSAQIAWHLREGDPRSASLLLSLLDFDRLGRLTREGLARTNRIQDGRLLSDYRLLDLQLRAGFELAGMPMQAGLDLVRNLGAKDQRDGARLDLRLGDAGIPRGWELGYAVQRLQRDAVAAAFNDDDWWFHSFARGYSLWFGYGVSSHWRLRLQGFVETRDGLDHSTRRVLLDLEARW